MIHISKNPLRDNYKWVYPEDPAVQKPVYPADHEKAGEVDADAWSDLYERYLDGTVEMPTKTGQTPTTWELRHLTERERRRVEETQWTSLLDSAYLAVSFALVAAIQPDGRYEVDRAPDVRGFDRVTDEYMDALGQFDKGSLINAMYGRIVRSLEPPGNS